MAFVVTICSALTVLVVLTGYYLGWGGLFLFAIALMFVVPWVKERLRPSGSREARRGHGGWDTRDADAGEL